MIDYIEFVTTDREVDAKRINDEFLVWQLEKNQYIPKEEKDALVEEFLGRKVKKWIIRHEDCDSTYPWKSFWEPQLNPHSIEFY